MSNCNPLSPSLNQSSESSLVNKKKEQWARERAEGSETWFPFGRPGAGAPNKLQLSSVDNSSSIGQYADTSRWSSVGSVVGSPYMPVNNDERSSPPVLNGQYNVSGSFPGQSFVKVPPPTHLTPITQLQHFPLQESQMAIIDRTNYYNDGAMYVHRQQEPVFYGPMLSRSQSTPIQLPFPSQHSLSSAARLSPIFTHNSYTNFAQRRYMEPDPAMFSYVDQSSSRLLPDCHSDIQSRLSADQQAQKTAVVNPLVSASRVSVGETPLSPLQIANLTISDFRKTISGVEEEKQAIGPLNVHSRQRTLTDTTEDDLEEKHQKMLETQLNYDEQIAEKKRQEELEMERERLETAVKEEERLRIDRELDTEAAVEMDRWKQRQAQIERKEQEMNKALEKAQREAQLTRKALLFSHALQAYQSSDDTRLVANDQLADFEKAQQLVQAIDRQKRLDNEIISGAGSDQSPLQSKNTPVTRSGHHQQHQSKNDDRPLKPALDSHHKDEKSLSRRRHGSARLARKCSAVNEDNWEEKKTEEKSGFSNSQEYLSTDEKRRQSKKAEEDRSVRVDGPELASTDTSSKAPRSSRSVLLDNCSEENKMTKKDHSRAVVQTDGRKGKNPWGDSLGGMNPLFQPLVTRPRRSRPSVESPPIALDNKSNESNAVAANDLWSAKENEQRKGYRLRSRPLQSPSSILSVSPSVLPVTTEPFQKSTAAYRSFNVKRSTGTSDRQQRVLEQLSALREQLQSKQKALFSHSQCP